MMMTIPSHSSDAPQRVSLGVKEWRAIIGLALSALMLAGAVIGLAVRMEHRTTMVENVAGNAVEAATGASASAKAINDKLDVLTSHETEKIRVMSEMSARIEDMRDRMKRVEMKQDEDRRTP